MPLTILDVSVFPCSKRRLIDADWKHKVAVGIIRDGNDATGNQATKLEGVDGKVMRQIRVSEMAAVLVCARRCFAGFTGTLVISSNCARRYLAEETGLHS